MLDTTNLAALCVISILAATLVVVGVISTRRGLPGSAPSPVPGPATGGPTTTTPTRWDRFVDKLLSFNWLWNKTTGKIILGVAITAFFLGYGFGPAFTWHALPPMNEWTHEPHLAEIGSWVGRHPVAFVLMVGSILGILAFVPSLMGWEKKGDKLKTVVYWVAGAMVVLGLWVYYTSLPSSSHTPIASATHMLVTESETVQVTLDTEEWTFFTIDTRGYPPGVSLQLCWVAQGPAPQWHQSGATFQYRSSTQSEMFEARAYRGADGSVCPSTLPPPPKVGTGT